MENNHNSELDVKNNLNGLNKELEQKRLDLIKVLKNSTENEMSLDPDKKLSEVIGNIFYNSMKSLFDTGAKLVKSLTSELFPESRDK